MKIENLKADLEEGDVVYRGSCHDCKTPVIVTAKVAEDDTIAIEGGSVYKIEQGTEERLFFKCDDCFKKDPILLNFRQCEVYSRVVGYLRPVNQWNKGKLEEFKQRKVFKNIEK